MGLAFGTLMGGRALGRGFLALLILATTVLADANSLCIFHSVYVGSNGCIENARGRTIMVGPQTRGFGQIKFEYQPFFHIVGAHVLNKSIGLSVSGTLVHDTATIFDFGFVPLDNGPNVVEFLINRQDSIADTSAVILYSVIFNRKATALNAEEQASFGSLFTQLCTSPSAVAFADQSYNAMQDGAFYSSSDRHAYITLSRGPGISSVEESLTVSIKTRRGDEEVVTLKETSRNSDNYRGSIRLVWSPDPLIISGNNKINVAAPDSLFVEYKNPAFKTGSIYFDMCSDTIVANFVKEPNYLVLYPAAGDPASQGAYPDSLAVRPNQPLQLWAKVFDARGNWLAVPGGNDSAICEWSAEGFSSNSLAYPTPSPFNIFRSTKSAGEGLIICRHPGTGLADTLRVTVTDNPATALSIEFASGGKSMASVGDTIVFEGGRTKDTVYAVFRDAYGNFAGDAKCWWSPESGNSEFVVAAGVPASSAMIIRASSHSAAVGKILVRPFDSPGLAKYLWVRMVPWTFEELEIRRGGEPGTGVVDTVGLGETAEFECFGRRSDDQSWLQTSRVKWQLVGHESEVFGTSVTGPVCVFRPKKMGAGYLVATRSLPNGTELVDSIRVIVTPAASLRKGSSSARNQLRMLQMGMGLGRNIRFLVVLPRTGLFEMSVFDAMGKWLGKVREYGQAGKQHYVWPSDKSGISSGVYVIRLQQGKDAHTKRFRLFR